MCSRVCLRPHLGSDMGGLWLSPKIKNESDFQNKTPQEARNGTGRGVSHPLKQTPGLYRPPSLFFLLCPLHMPFLSIPSSFLPSLPPPRLPPFPLSSLNHVLHFLLLFSNFPRKGLTNGISAWGSTVQLINICNVSNIIQVCS